MSEGSFCKRPISLSGKSIGQSFLQVHKADICDSCFDIGRDRFGSGVQESVHGKRKCWSWRFFKRFVAFWQRRKDSDDEEEKTKHRCLRFLFHLGCLWIIFQRQKGGESSYWASLLILTWLRGGTHTLAASATLFHQQLPQHFTLLNTILPSTHPCHNCLLRHPSVFNYFYISLFQHC